MMTQLPEAMGFYQEGSTGGPSRFDQVGVSFHAGNISLLSSGGLGASTKILSLLGSGHCCPTLIFSEEVPYLLFYNGSNWTETRSFDKIPREPFFPSGFLVEVGVEAFSEGLRFDKYFPYLASDTPVFRVQDEEGWEAKRPVVYREWGSHSLLDSQEYAHRKEPLTKKQQEIKKRKRWLEILALGEGVAMDQTLPFLERVVVGWT